MYYLYSFKHFNLNASTLKARTSFQASKGAFLVSGTQGQSLVLTLSSFAGAMSELSVGFFKLEVNFA